MLKKSIARLLTSLCENYDQPLPSVTALNGRSSRIMALLSRDQRERSIDTLFKETLTRAAHSRVVVAAFACTIGMAPLAAQAPQKIYHLYFGQNLHLTLSANAMQLAVIFTLAMLLAVALVLALVARRQARQAQAANQRTLAIIDTALDGVITMDHDGRIVEFNPAAERIFGYRSGEVIGRKLADTIIPPHLREHHNRGLAHYLATGEGPVLGKRIEMAGVRADGTQLPLELSITRMPGAGPPMFTGFVRDITERKRAEAERALLAGIVQFSDDAIISESLDGVVTSWNAGAERVFGYSSEEIIGHSIGILIPPEATKEEMEILARIQTGESTEHYETERVKKDGNRVAVSLTVSPLKDAAGKIIGASKIVRDITDRKRAEQRLQAQLERLNLLDQITRAIAERQDLPSVFQVVIRSLEDSLPIDFGCVCLYDPATQVLTVTSVGVRSEALAMDLALTEQASIPIDENGLARCVSGELVHEPDISQSAFAFPGRLARGGLRSLVVAPLRYDSGIFGVLVAARKQTNSFSSGDCEFLRQLSEHVALAARQAQIYSSLQQAYDELRQTQQAVMQHERLRALGQMASGIAHDINNALSPVALYTEMLLEKELNLSVRARQHLEITQRAVEDVAHTVGRMREFYRLPETQSVLLPVNLNELVQQVLDLTRARWSDMPQRQGILIQMRTELAPDLPAIVGIESEIREALVNLVFNAVDAMPDGGALTLRTKASPNGSASVPPLHVHVEVEDMGLGMDEETRRRCLEPFFTTKGERGTGLGLAMVFGVAQRHNAEIEIESAVGKGTIVRLTFPIPAATSAMVQTAQPSAAPSRLRILLVDDDPLMIKSLRDTLEGDGHTVVTANGGQEGIDVFLAAADGREQFAVVITDLGMPRVDGRKVATHVKARSPSTPVILLTGWGQRLVAEGDVPPHVDRVLSKPPKLRELRNALAELVASLNPA
jgi:PAS domain S-box-containing protein